MSRKITTEISFKIESKFEELVKIFEIEEADIRHSEYDIKPLFIGLSKEDPRKVISIYKASEEIYKSLLRKLLNGIKVIKLITKLWKNHLGYEGL